MIYRILAVLTHRRGDRRLAAAVPTAERHATATTAVQENGWDEGYSAQNARLVETGADGLPLYTLNAATIRQLPNEGQVQLTQVQMTFRDAEWRPLDGKRRPRRALEQAAAQVMLSGNVHVSGTPAAARGPRADHHRRAVRGLCTAISSARGIRSRCSGRARI